MTKQDQIDEMANDLAKHCPDLVENCCCDSYCVSCIARGLHAAGYRKQVVGEWETGLQTCSYLSGTDAEYCCECNVCGGFAVDAFAYCPECGAKMKGGTE